MSLRHLELYFAGGEVPTWRKLLKLEKVPHVAVNYLHLQPRINKKPWLLSEFFPDEQEIFLLSGSASTEKKQWTQHQHEAFLASYLEFVQDNIGRLKFFTEYDALSLGLEWVLRQRDMWAGLADDKLVPVWHEEWGAPALRNMVEAHPNLGVPPVTPRTQNVLSGLVRRTRLNLHGLSFSHPYDAPGGLYSTIVSSSWISPTRFGETVVWDQDNRLRRYGTDEKEKVRTRHRGHFTAAGFDADKILHDDNQEVARYTIWAWRQMELSMEAPDRMRVIKRGRSTTSNGHGDPEDAPAGNGVVDHAPLDVQGNGYLPMPVPAPTQVPLPVFSFQQVTTMAPDPNGPGTIEVTSPVPVVGTAPIRRCDNCSLAVVCPLFESGCDCKYSIPIQIRNRDQLMGILHSLLEVQGQRIAFGRFSEELQGGYPDANLSAELDRFMRMTQSVKEIQDNRDFLKVTVEGRAQAGVLARLFGAERADTLHRVDPDRAEDAVKRTLG